MITVTLTNQKGGVAKTTSCLAMASGLTQRGYHVLAVDLDPQSNFSMSAGVDILGLKRTVYDVFKGSVTVNDVIVKSPLGYDVIPGGLALASADMELTKTGREFILKESLRTVSDQYDFCVIDTAPTLGVLTVNALTASDYEVVPMAADAYSLQGLGQLSMTINQVKRYCNPGLKISGLLVTRFHGEQNSAKVAEEMIETAAKQLKTNVYRSRIRESVAVRDAALAKNDFLVESPRANATVDYNGFIDEWLEGVNNGKEKED